jgi:hypothetical protein
MSNAYASEGDQRAVTIHRDWLKHQGYVPDEIDALMAEPDHSECIRGQFGWECENEEGIHRHPEHLETKRDAYLIMFVLEHRSYSVGTQMPTHFAGLTSEHVNGRHPGANHDR